MLPKIADAALLDAFRASPTGEKITAEATRKLLEHRQKLADVIRAADAEAAKQWPIMSKAIDAAREKHVAADRAMRETVTACRRAEIARSSMTVTLDARREAAAAELREGANPAIAVFREWLRDEEAATCKTLRAFDETSRRPFGRKSVTGFTNKTSVLERLAAVRGGRSLADELALVVDQEIIPETIAAWCSGLPNVCEPVAAGEPRLVTDEAAE